MLDTSKVTLCLITFNIYLLSLIRFLSSQQQLQMTKRQTVNEWSFPALTPQPPPLTAYCPPCSWRPFRRIFYPRLRFKLPSRVFSHRYNCALLLLLFILLLLDVVAVLFANVDLLLLAGQPSALINIWRHNFTKSSKNGYICWSAIHFSLSPTQGEMVCAFTANVL